MYLLTPDDLFTRLFYPLPVVKCFMRNNLCPRNGLICTVYPHIKYYLLIMMKLYCLLTFSLCRLDG